MNRQAWEMIARSHTPQVVIKYLSFKDALRVAYRLLYNDKWDSELQSYAIELFNIICESYPEEWNASWEYDALLGLACDITSQHEERYLAYKRAFDKANPKPPRLLIEFARCCICPGSPPIAYDHAINLIMTALKDKLYVDGVSLLCNIYSLKNDEIKKEYWTKVLSNIDDNEQTRSPSIEPAFLVEEYLRDLKKKS